MASFAAIHYTFSRLYYSSLYWFSFVVLIIVWMCPKNFFLTLNTRHFSQSMRVRQWLKNSFLFKKIKEASWMMWCIVVTTENILPHTSTEQSFREKNCKPFAKRTWENSKWLGFLQPSPSHFPLSSFVSFFLMLQQLPSLQYCLSFLIVKKDFSLYFSSKYTYTIKCFFQVVIGDWKNTNHF